MNSRTEKASSLELETKVTREAALELFYERRRLTRQLVLVNHSLKHRLTELKRLKALNGAVKRKAS